METKQDIRNKLLIQRNYLPILERSDYSQAIMDTLVQQESFKSASHILIYVNYQSEVDTRNIIRYAMQNGKKVFCPKVLRPGYMEFYPIKALSDLIPGYKGIPEPFITHKCYIPKEEYKPLMIMPLVGFDEQKNRLGYGAGFYDRYLQKYEFIPTIALGYECQKYEHLPIESTDRVPNAIITEKNIY